MKFRIFHKQSGIQSMRDSRESLDIVPSSEKIYERFPKITLPKPRRFEEAFGSALLRRRSERDFSNAPLKLSDIGDVLHAAGGFNPQMREQGQPPHRHHPSGGALYPLEYYVAVFRVENLESGIYHFVPREHALEHIIVADPEMLRNAYRDVVPPCNPAAVIVMTSVWGRSYPKYGDYAYRLALIETGHSAQNALLAAEICKLRAFPAAAFHEDILAKALDIDDEDPLYLIFLGK